MPIFYDNISLSIKEKLVFISVICTLGLGLGLLFYESIKAGICLTLLFSLTLPKYKMMLVNQRKSKLLMQFRDVLYSLSSSIYAGRSMTKALQEAKEFCESTYKSTDYILIELNYMNRCITNGLEEDKTVLRDFAKRSGLADIDDFVSVYESCKLTGGNLPQTINRAISIIGDKIGLEHEIKSLLSQKIFEGRIVGVAPIVVVGFVKMSSPEYFSPMVYTEDGKILATLALVLLGVGLLIIEGVKKIDI